MNTDVGGDAFYAYGSDPLHTGDDVLVDVVGEDRRIICMSPEQRRLLGLEASAVNLDLNVVYDSNSISSIAALFERSFPDGYQTALELSLLGRGGRQLSTFARCTRLTINRQPAFRLTKILSGPLVEQLAEARSKNVILSRIIETAQEGHWCIEFMEPVNIRVSCAEVVEQIFENASVWSVANPAMARLYDLPQGHEIRAEDVRLYWPRSPENESFVTQIIESGYVVDRAVSFDMRHDGSPIKMENDVRAEIDGDFLYRIWGNCRQVHMDHHFAVYDRSGQS